MTETRTGATPYCMAPALPADRRGLAPEWRYLPRADIYQHHVTGELRAWGSSLGYSEQLPLDYTPLMLLRFTHPARGWR